MGGMLKSPSSRAVLVTSILLGILGARAPAAADLAADPIAVDFGDVAIVRFGGAGSSPVTFFVEVTVAIRNIGAASVEIADAVVDPAKHFQIVKDKCGVLAPGEECPLLVRFLPRGKGMLGATLVVRASDGEELTVPLWGDAVEVACSGSECDGPVLSFGSGPPGKSIVRNFGVLNETGGDLLARVEVASSETFSAPIASPPIVPDGGEYSVPIVCNFSGAPGPRKGLCTWDLPPPMLPVVRAVKIPLVANVSGCLEPLGSSRLPSGMLLDREKKREAFCTVALPRKADSGISRRLMLPREMAGRKAISVSGIRYAAMDTHPDFLWLPTTLRGREEFLATVPILTARAKKVEEAGLVLEKRMKGGALALGKREAAVIDLESGRKIGGVLLEGRVAGIVARSRLMQARVYGIRRKAEGPLMTTLTVRPREEDTSMGRRKIVVDSVAMPRIAGRRAESVKALSPVALPARNGAWREKLVVAARYPSADLLSPSEDVLLLLGKRGREIDARLKIPPLFGDVTSLAARRKKGPVSCLMSRKVEPPGISAMVGTASGRLLGIRAKRDEVSGRWSWAVARKLKLPHRVQDLLWKGEEVYSCGRVTQDLIAVGRREISLLGATGGSLEVERRLQLARKEEIYSTALPAFALRREMKPLYVLEKRADGGGRVAAYRSCRSGGEPPDPLGSNNLKPVLLTGDCTFLACKKAAEERVRVKVEAYAFDPEGKPLRYSWTAPGIEFDDPTSPTPSGDFPAGETLVYLVVRDGPADDPDARESEPRIVRVIVSEQGCGPLPCTPESFDPNGDGKLDISDPIMVLAYLFTGGPAPKSLQSADPNGDGKVDISDPVYFLTFLFVGGDPPVCPAGL